MTALGPNLSSPGTESTAGPSCLLQPAHPDTTARKDSPSLQL